MSEHLPLVVAVRYAGAENLQPLCKMQKKYPRTCEGIRISIRYFIVHHLVAAGGLHRCFWY